jgi:ABC-type transporter Mla MlaB component
VTLKISRSTSTNGVVLALSGEMQGDELADLALLVEGATPGRVALDLGDVTLVDRKAVDFIRIAVAAGAALVNCPAYIRRWIAAEQTKQ